jgi:hypothetical protein
VSGALSWSQRWGYAAIAFGGTAAYAYSFTVSNSLKDLAHLALKVGVASGICWPIFGAAVLAATRGIKNLMAWADICLVTMAWGMAVLSIGTILNCLHVAIPTTGHAAILIAGNLVMGYSFVSKARVQSLKTEAAIALWLLVLDLPFILIVWLWP